MTEATPVMKKTTKSRRSSRRSIAAGCGSLPQPVVVGGRPGEEACSDVKIYMNLQVCEYLYECIRM